MLQMMVRYNGISEQLCKGKTKSRNQALISTNRFITEGGLKSKQVVTGIFQIGIKTTEITSVRADSL